MKNYILLYSFVVVLVLSTQPEVGHSRKLVRNSSDGRRGHEAQAEEVSFEDGKPHVRRKRTIGHIFNMFKGFMNNMFGNGGGKKGRGRGRGKGRGRGRPRPPSNYGAPQINVGPGFNQQQQAPALDNYGSPQAPSLDSYGSPQAPALGGGGDLDSYGSPQAPVIGNNDPDSYGSPQSAPLGPGNLANYGSQQAPFQQNLNNYGSPQAPIQQNLNSYGSPQAPIQQNLNSYGSPQAPIQQNLNNFGQSQGFLQQNLNNYGSPQVAAQQNLNNYGSPQALGQQSLNNFGPPQGTRQQNLNNYGSTQPSGQQIPNNFGASQSPLQQIPNNYGSPQPPAQQIPSNYGSPQVPGNLGLGNQRPNIPNRENLPSYGSNGVSPSGSIAPPGLADSVFKMLPAPNLATEAPNLSGQAQDSYGSPQSNPLNVLNQNSGQQFGQPAGQSYGSPQVNQIDSRPPLTSYGSPEVGFANPSQQTYSNPFLSSNQQPQTQPVSFPNGVNPRIVNNPADTLPTYGPSANNNNFDDQPEGELVSIQVEGEDEVRGQNAVTKQTDPPASSTKAPASSSKGKKSNKNTGKDLTGEDDNYDDSATTTIEPIFPGYEDVDYDQANYQYDDSDVRDFPGLPGGLPGYLDNQGTYGNRPLDISNFRQPVVNQQNDLRTYNSKPAEQAKNQDVKAIKSQSDVKPDQPGEERSKSVNEQEVYGKKGDKPKEKEKGNKKVETVTDVEELVQDVGEEEGEEVEEVEELNQEIKGQQEADQNSDRLPQSNDGDLFNEYDSNSQLEEDEEEDIEDGNEVEDEDQDEDEDVRPGPSGSTTEAAFISVPLLIEEVSGKEDGDEDGPGDPTVILAGSPDDAKQPDTGYGAPGVRKGRENDVGEFHQFLVEAPNAKRQADWSQRVRERQRKRVWRQFQLD